MVDVSGKPVTRRVAAASCRVLLSADTVARLSHLPKGDAFAVSRLAGIQGAKRTSDLVPLAHPLPLDQVEVELQPVAGGIEIRSRVVATARTGAEMEALAACAAAALALYDMVKAVERGAVITDLRLEAKSGGRSGDYRRDEESPGEESPGEERRGEETRGEGGSEKAGSEKAGSEKAGSEKAGSEKAGSEKAGSEKAGSEEAREGLGDGGPQADDARRERWRSDGYDP